MVLPALLALPAMLAAPLEYAVWLRAFGYPQGKAWSIEFILSVHYGAVGLAPFVRRINTFEVLTVRTKSDRTRWSPGRAVPGLGIYVKYPLLMSLWPTRCVALLLRATNASELERIVDH